jgi:hypothetical protein
MSSEADAPLSQTMLDDHDQKKVTKLRIRVVNTGGDDPQ